MAGRIGNFINGELWGKPTDLPWGFGVPNAEGQLIARHPSQLYEATLEGWCCSWCCGGSRASRGRAWRRRACFLVVYGCARFTVEWVRLPDANIGYLVGDWLTMGMLLDHTDDSRRRRHDDLRLPARQPSGNLSAAKA